MNVEGEGWRDGRRPFGDEIGRKIWGRKIGNHEWRMANGEWRMANGEWRMADGGWRMADGGWRIGEGGNLIGWGLDGRLLGLFDAL